MPSLVVDVVTLGVLFVGFTGGYYFRAWREREDAMEELRFLRLGDRVREWIKKTDA